jgi:hypothetical protein
LIEITDMVSMTGDDGKGCKEVESASEAVELMIDGLVFAVYVGCRI